MRAAVLVLALIATPATAQVTDAAARAFAVRQEQAWNAGRLDAYFAGFTPTATFTDQAYVGDKPPVPYGTSTLKEARTQARRTLAGGRSHEAGRVLRVEIAPDSRSARVTSNVASTLEAKGKVRHLCATRVQALVATPGGLRASRQTDTFIRCRR